MPIRLTVAPTEVVVLAGSVIRAVVTMENVGLVSEGFSLRVDGLPASWYSFPPRSIVLDPGQSHQVDLVVHPPHNASSTTTCTLIAFDPQGGKDSATLTLPVSVAARDVSISVEPSELSGRRGILRAYVRNARGTPIGVRISAHTVEQYLRARVEPSETIMLGAEQVAEVIVRVEALRDVGHASVIDVTGVVVAEAGAKETIPGGRVLFNYEAGKRLPRPLQPIANALVLLALLAVALFVILPRFTASSNQRTSASSPSSTQAPAHVPTPSPRATAAAPVQGKGFTPGEPITIALDGAAVTTTTADKNGHVSIPPALLVGRGGSVSASGASGGVSELVASAPRSDSSAFYSAVGQNTANTHTTIDLLNTGATTTRTALHFYFANGSAPSTTLQLAPHQHRLIPVASVTRQHGVFGLLIQGQGSVATRLSTERVHRAGDTVAPAQALSRTWYFAEGYTGLRFKESIYVFNPHPAGAAHVTLILTSAGLKAPLHAAFVVAPRVIHEIDVRRLVSGYSVGVAVSSDLAVVAQRSLTFSSEGGRQGYGAVDTPGVARTAATWFFPAGIAMPIGETYISVLDPGDSVAHVTMHLYAPGGKLVFTRTVVVGARSRSSIVAPQVLLKTAAVVVTSSVPVVVEHLSYLSAPNGPRTSGFTIDGANGVASHWAFANGSLSTGHDILALFNPASRPVHVALRVYTLDGTRTLTLVVGPHMSRTLNAARIVPAGSRPTGVVVLTGDDAGIVAALTYVDAS